MEIPGALAAVDCGTNSTRLLVVGSAGDVRAREMTITRLGEGVDATHRLRPEAMERTFAALRDYRSIMDAERVRRTRLVATSAVRDAVNGDDFLLPRGRHRRCAGRAALRERGGPPLLSRRDGRPAGAGRGRHRRRHRWWLHRARDERRRGDPVGVPRHRVRAAHGALPPERSADGGSRWLLRCGPSQPSWIGQQGRSPCWRTRARPRGGSSAWPGRCRRWPAWSWGWPTTTGSGSITRCCTRDAVDAVVRRPGCRTGGRRARRPGLPAGRQDVIFGGALVLREVMRRFDLPECIVSESDILDGLILSMRPPA